MTQGTIVAERPVFEIAIESVDLASEVRVNDIPVLRLPGGAVRSSFDVNPYVMTGTNTLSLLVRPNGGGESFGAVARATVALRRRPSPESKERETLATLVFEGPGGDVAHGFERSPGYATETPPLVRRLGLGASQSFELQTPFPPWFFVNAPMFTRTEALRTELLDAYRRIHALLRARDIGGLLAASALQARDFQAAYYLTGIAEAHRLLGVAAILGDTDVVAEDFPDAALDVEILAGGRLAQLVDQDGKGPLRLSVKSASAMAGRFNCVLARAAGGLAIAR